MASDRDILPDNVKPSHYHLYLYEVELGGAFSYQGVVTIDLEIRKGTKDIVLNSYQLQIHEAEIQTEHTKTELNFKSSNITYDASSQRATITFPEELPVSSKASLKIRFEGIINNLMAGYYRSRYKPAVTPAKSVPQVGEHHYMFSTQFESSDARRAFPCFDEPNLKATFDVELEVPDDLVALSNMPEKETRKSNKEGMKVVSFERTPIMSTYLLAWAVGDFEYVETFTKRKYNGRHMPVRVYTTRGLKEQGQRALENASRVVDYFSEIFRIEYPLPKADLLAVHEFSHGAMENWGLVTYRTTAVLFDEAHSDPKYKNRVAYVVAHELAHQWFGNLVTMDWWSELWLNEGFATWVGWLATDHFNPGWKVWTQFVSESMQTAFTLDSIRKSHPIEVPVRDALEVDQIFDHISYLKGSSVIRMLSAHLGVDTFLKGVGDYLEAHKFGNATTNDLWTALSKASGQDVNSFMDNWIRKIGFPVLTVAEEPGQISIRQSRFLASGDATEEEDKTIWWIPLGIKTGPQASLHKMNALTQKEDTVREVDESFYKINTDQTGFYRTNYPPQRLIKLGAAQNSLSDEDKIGLVGDASALAQSGHGTTAAFLALIENFKSEQNYLVWQQILKSLSDVRAVFSDVDDVSAGLRKFTLELVEDAAEKIGWNASSSEDLLTTNLRSLLIRTAGAVGHQPTIDEAKKRFADIPSIHPSLRLAVFNIAVRQDGKSAYDEVKAEYSNTTSIDGKEICLQALGKVRDPSLAQDLLDFTFSPAVATQDRHTPGISLASNAKTRYQLWTYIRDNWSSKIFPELSGNMVVLERFVRVCLNKFSSHEVNKEIKDFFEGKDCRGFDRGLGVVYDTVESSAKYRERDVDVVREWLTAHKFI